MWALLPRIFRFKSWLKPPITLTTLDSAHELIATPQIDSTLMTVRNPLFCERTWRAATNETNVRPSIRSSSHGSSADSTPTTNAAANTSASADATVSM
jgi:hypothetical protein